MTRTWCFLLAACAAPVRPPPPAPLSHAAAETKQPPAGMFVADLITRRVDVAAAATECADGTCARRAAPLGPAQLALFARNALRPAPVMVPPGGPAPQTVTVEYCVDETGHVASVRAPGALTPRDRAYVERMRSWRFAAYFVGGKPITACSFLTFESR